MTRRQKRCRRRRTRGRRNLSKFIPSSDRDFALTAGQFAAHLAAHPAECGISAEQAEVVAESVGIFRGALAKVVHRGSRTQLGVLQKNEARQRAETVIREIANIIRAHPGVDAQHKFILRIRRRPARLRKRPCPKRAPMLIFRGSRDGVRYEAGTGGGSGAHILEFLDVGDTLRKDLGIIRRARPEGAVRLELFVDLVPAGQPVPGGPLDCVRAGRGWPWYLRSFTRSPIEVQFPLPAQPALVCYWGRWADSSGEVSRFSQTCIARIEGWTPGSPAPGLPAPAPAPAPECVAAALPGKAARVSVEMPEPRCLEPKIVIVRLPYIEDLIAESREAREAQEAQPPPLLPDAV